MDKDALIEWLLAGDIAIQYQTHRDLLGDERPDLQARIATEGWGARFLALQQPEGHWGKSYYQPKWISTHYTLLDLRLLGFPREHARVRKAIQQVLETGKGEDGGINPSRGVIKQSDVCISGMFLNIATYFGMPEEYFHSIVDFLIDLRMTDGGFNCRLNRSGARHSSMHSTLSVLEGLTTYEQQGYTYRLAELQAAKHSAVEFLLLHQLFRSDRTGEIIHKDFLRLSFPGRWRFDILRALDFFQAAGLDWDDRLAPAIDVLRKKRNKDGTWNVQAKIPGQVHFDMEKSGQPSRWNTLRALRVLAHFGMD